ncbi:hypothetical protein [Prosthecobacter sp.]|uniref:hypothetical protein n=1 Tax=Prosthecobacter sp. TaxID=1965333 RepID=UPI003783D8BC
MNPTSQLWVELVGEIIVARIRGIPTEELIRECQQRVIALQADTRCTRVLYDALELERPPIEIVLTQQSFSAELKDSALCVAIVVPNTSIAYLARLAFGDLNHRVFYNDIAAAILWLMQSPAEKEKAG